MNKDDANNSERNSEDIRKSSEWLHLHEVIKAIHESVQVAEELNESSSGPHFGIDEFTIEFTSELDVKKQEEASFNKEIKEKNNKSSATGLASILRFHNARPDETTENQVNEKMLTKITLRFGKKITLDKD